MEQIIDYVKPELLILVFVCWGIGLVAKSSQMNNKHIPLLLCLSSIALAALWVVATSTIHTPQDASMAAFVAITQGVVCWLVSWGLYEKAIKPASKKNQSESGE